jgi:hypothetical protein
MNVVRISFLLMLALLISGCGDGVPPPGNYATVTGKVTDAATGSPFASASVSINGVQYALTDATGTYKITTVPTGPWSWSASADGFTTGGSDSPSPLTPGEKRDFPITLTRH